MADFHALEQVRDVATANGVGTGKRIMRLYKDLGSEVFAPAVAIAGLDGDVTLTGDVVVDTLGALNNAKVVNPDAASATIPALLRGALAQQLAILALAATLGAVNNASETDPDAASATIPSLLRGVLEQQASILTALSGLSVAIGAAADAVGANTVIGQLKQIAENTTPA
jgi:hypothetical protein